ncbi:hypothetical protein [Sphingomonas qomolangmaensis]|uniref:Terminase small subunit n=1 Tax=Sphingomonas qomolangmaensis TaxID=2918765 RepID=A0ABY5L7W3_9SPHN|nr:hypothetical protein [Sphingomonas qomolangmaensis]UUL81889.1 hypothetical protein NMP03_11900 [Sphingomonas qomolangmaensis]
MPRSRRPIPPAPPADDAANAMPDFDPVPLRERSDGWTPDRQIEFIEALAATGCVAQAAESVGMNRVAAYRLRGDPRAASFRAAWRWALEHAVGQLSDAVTSRAIHGVARPVFFQGKQVGERRYYDERLAMFLLRYRDPMRYGAWIDKVKSASRHPEANTLGLFDAMIALCDDAHLEQFGDPPARRRPMSPGSRCVMPDTPEEAHEKLVAENDRLRQDWGKEAERADDAEFDLAELRASIAAASQAGAAADGSAGPEGANPGGT